MLKIFLMAIHKSYYRWYNLYAWYVSKIIKSCGKDLKIWGNISIKNPNNLIFGNNVSLNDGIYINALAPIIIGNNVSISAGAIIVSTGLDTALLKREKVHFSKKILIGNSVQIGAGAIILPGIVIGDNVIVGAGSIVTKNIESNTIIAGNPAKVLRVL